MQGVKANMRDMRLGMDQDDAAPYKYLVYTS